MLDLINLYTHGFVAVPVILACKKKGLFQVLQQQGSLTLEQMVDLLNANSGHLQVALRMMQSLNWLSQNQLGEYSLTPEAEIYNTIPQDILDLYHLPIDSYLLGKQKSGFLKAWIERSKYSWDVSDPLIADFLDGILIIPILLGLKKNNLLKSGEQKHLFSELNSSVREELCELFVHKQWGNIKEDSLALTDAGKFIFERALLAGTVASYTPMLSHINDLLFGDCQAVFSRHIAGYENHVDRTLNVIASGFQHRKYFADIDEMILAIFNRLPFAEQPKYVADMGCGDGTLLKRVYTTIKLKSARGKVLDQYPIGMIGIDYNQASLNATVNTLADIPHLVIKGDIGDPEQLVVDLQSHQIHDFENILHIRSFLDHDRPFISPQKLDKVNTRSQIPYQGVYVDANGHLIPPSVMIQSLVEHLDRWSSVVTKHGLIILEVHCLEPKVVYKFLDQSENLYFDACQAFSMQHLIEAEVFLMAAAEVGLFPKFEFSKRYPKTFPFTRITLNCFEKQGYKIRHPHLSDLPALINLEAKCWPEHLRVSADEIQRRLELFPNGHCLLEIDEKIVGIIYSQKISSVNVLETASYQNISSLHTDEGSIIQLLSLNILPEMQDQGLGDILREFMLQWCTLKGGITGVVGVTRCKNYVNQSQIPMEEYILQRNNRGQILDPILRFHEEGGAKIKKIIPNYRPEDGDNLGIGVLIEYDIQNLPTSNSNSEIKVQQKLKQSQQNSQENLNTIVYESIRTVIGEQRMKAFSWKYPLMEIGLDSLELLELRALLGEHFGIKLEPTFFFQYGTPESISSYFQHGATVAEKDVEPSWTTFIPDETEIAGESETNSLKVNITEEEGFAVIGMACRFPGSANSPEEYWSLLRHGIDGITEVPKTRWDIEEYYDDQQSQTNKISSKYGGFIDRVDQFDAQFFRISPREATYTDPQQRILLEETWKALENSGIDPQSLAGTQTGVFVGIFGHDYQLLQVKQNHKEEFENYFGTGNSASIAAGRLSYFFGFTGPAIAVDTACSSSLVALHLACQSLHNGECDLALASGVNLLLSPELSITFSQSRMLSPDGRCKTFDASANGYVRSEGCGVIVLKRLSQAIADNDNILAVVRGTAINQDGTSNGLTAPNEPSQEAVINRALSVAGVQPHEVSYVEAHGTGTSLGDPVEITALEAVYGQGRTPENPLTIGSAKTNIGHTEAAAGIAGLIKVVLAMQNQYIPPHLHFQALNPHIHLDNIPAVIPQQGREWKANLEGNRRLAGVSSFGFSGTNAHVILEEAPASVNSDQNRKYRLNHLLTLSAKTPKALEELVESYQDYLKTHRELELADICYTANRGRTHFSHRLVVIASNQQELAEKLLQHKAGEEVAGIFSGELTSSTNSRNRDIVFLFTGQGSQYVNMGRQLYQTQPVFREAIAQCDTILSSELEQPLLSVLYPNLGNREQPTGNREESLLDQTAYTQPALFAIEYALFKLWESWGIKPDVVMGHSVGEYVAACVAGVFSLEDGLKLIAHRGRLMQQLPHGGEMLAVMASEEKVNQLIAPYREKVAIAAINGSVNIVISGEAKAIGMVQDSLEAEGIKTKQLQVSHAFHSPLMEPMLADFEAVANQITYNQPRIPLISNVTGTRADESIATASYWVNHVRQPVKFAQSMETLHQEGYELFLEIGPKPILLGMGRQCLPEEVGVWLPSLRPGQPDWQQMLQSLGELYVRGVKVDWSGFDRDYSRNKVVLPTYPFQRQRYWIETGNSLEHKKQFLSNHENLHPLLGQRLHLAGLEEQIRFECLLSASEPAYFNHHRVFDKPILPATAYLEMALEAGAAIFKSDNLILEDVIIQQALVLPEDKPKTIQVILTPSGTKSYTFEIFSLSMNKEQEEQLWTLHVSGKVLQAEKETNTRLIDLSVLQDQYTKQICVEKFYQRLQERGMDYGLSFQAVEKLWSQEKSALGLIQLSPDLSSGAEDYKTHPVILDASLHLVYGLVFGSDSISHLDTYLPVELKRLKLYHCSVNHLWSQVQLRSITGINQQTMTMDVCLFDEHGVIVAELEGFTWKRASQKALLNIIQKQLQENIPDWFYQVQWQQKPFQSKTTFEKNQNSELSHWLIFTDSTGVGQDLARCLQRQGHDCTLVYRGDRYENQEKDIYYLNPSHPEDFEHLLREIVISKQLPLKGVIHLWSLETALSEQLTINGLEEAQTWGCGSVLHLVQALLKQNGSASPRLWLVSRGSQPVNSDTASLSVAQAPLWGLGRVVALENPQLWGGMVDLDPEAPEDEVQMLLGYIQNDRGEDHIAFRSQESYVARLVKQLDSECKPLSLRSDSTYLITGGLGALGLHVAEWMIQQGVRSLVLIGRSKPSSQTQAIVNRLGEGEAKVIIAQGDVSNQGDMVKLLEQVKTSMPPLRGIIHAAGVERLEPIEKIELSQLESVLCPKVVGTWILHQLTQKMELDFFVSFSSIASVWGSKGQAHYAAANHFLDALAHYRQGQGLQALSVNWGPWAGGGMASNELQTWLSQTGIKTLQPEKAIAALGYLMKTDCVQTTVVDVNWTLFKQVYELKGHRSLLEEVAKVEVQQKSLQPKVSNFMQRLEVTPREGRRDLLLTYLREQVAKVLGLKASEQIGLRQSLLSLGIDSLMAVELRNHLQSSLGHSIPATVLFDYPTLEELVDYLAQQLNLMIDSSDFSQERPSGDSTEESSQLSDVTELSEVELEASVLKEIEELEKLI